MSQSSRQPMRTSMARECERTAPDRGAGRTAEFSTIMLVPGSKGQTCGAGLAGPRPRPPLWTNPDLSLGAHRGQAFRTQCDLSPLR